MRECSFEQTEDRSYSPHEPVIAHGIDEAGQPGGVERGRHIDVGAQAWTSPYDRRLRSKEIPPHVAFVHDGSESREEITDRVGT